MKIEAKKRILSGLTEKQKQLDINGDGKIDAEDLRRLRKGEKPQKVESSAKGLAETIRRKLAVDGVATSVVVTVGSGSAFQYDRDALPPTAESTPLEVMDLFIDLEKFNPVKVRIANRPGIDLIRFTIGGYSVFLNLSAGTVSVTQL